MPFGKGRRRLAWALGFLLIGGATICLALPIWFPWLLRPLASRAGISYAEYQRLGYTRWALVNASLTNSSLVLRAGRLEALLPSRWLWDLATRRVAADNQFLQLSDWHCELLPRHDTNASPPFAQIQDLAATLRTMQRWVPTLELKRGVVQSGKTVLTVPEATGKEGHLQAAVQLPPEASGRLLQVSLVPANPFQLQLDCAALSLASSIEILTNRSGLDLRSSIHWQTNQVQAQAHFGPADFLPQTGTVRGLNLQFPGEMVQMPQYAELSGSLVGQWDHGRFALEATAGARPGANQTNFPAVDLELRVVGDTNAAFIEKLAVRTPFADATLSNTLALSFAAPYVTGPASLAVSADLSRQLWFPVTGKLTGSLLVTRTQGKWPEVQLQLAGSNIGNDSLTASDLQVLARGTWPLLEVVRAEFRFPDGSIATLGGKLNMETKMTSDGQLHFEGPLVRRWLPPGYSYGRLSVSGTFNGPLQKLAHAGRFEADQATTPVFQPLSLRGEWTGESETLQSFTAQLSNTNAALALQGALSRGSDATELQLNRLVLSTNGFPALELSQPVTISVQPSKPGVGWTLETTPLRWSGPAGELSGQASLQWPTRGAVQLRVSKVGLDVFSGLIKTAPRIDVDRLEGLASWTNSPANVSLDLAARGVAESLQQGLQPSENSPTAATPSPKSDPAVAVEPPTHALLSTPLTVNLSLRGDANGIVLSNLVVSSPTSTVTVARGSLPLSWIPSSTTNSVHIESRLPVEFHASVRPQAFFWERLARWTGVNLQEPKVDLTLAGTWGAPQGQLTFQARVVQVNSAKFKALDLEDLRLALTLDQQEARLTDTHVLIQGQQLDLQGELPLGENFWNELQQKKVPDWRRASVRLQIRDAQLAAFEPLFPQVLAPQGQLKADLELRPGEQLEGTVVVRDARTRPLGSTAPFRDINVTLRVRDRLLSLENASATLSGASIDLSGQVDLRSTNWLAVGEWPPFRVTLRGTNVPLAREPDYIIRSDLDLDIVKTNGAAPLVSGAAHLRDSFYLSDLSALVPGGVAKPGSRPPYFSLDTPLLADWRLAIGVDGVRWLKVRTSLFDGELTANLHVQGTLKEPIALGGLRIDSGLVRFPFGSLQVQQGLVTLGSQDPYHPQLLVRANSKQFGYDIRMDVSGAADNPVIQFTSNPSLSSEQILLMMTAGQLPQGTYSLTPQQRAETMALFLGRDFLSKIGLADQTQERLTIRSGEEISEQGRPTYHVEYRFAKRWFIVGEYDRFGDYNAGFKWRVYSR